MQRTTNIINEPNTLYADLGEDVNKSSWEDRQKKIILKKKITTSNNFKTVLAAK